MHPQSSTAASRCLRRSLLCLTCRRWCARGRQPPPSLRSPLHPRSSNAPSWVLRRSALRLTRRLSRPSRRQRQPSLRSQHPNSLRPERSKTFHELRSRGGKPGRLHSRIAGRLSKAAGVRRNPLLRHPTLRPPARRGRMSQLPSKVSARSGRNHRATPAQWRPHVRLNYSKAPQRALHAGRRGGQRDAIRTTPSARPFV